MRARPRRSTDLAASFWFGAGLVALAGPVLMVIFVEIDRSAGNAGVLDVLVISPTSARTILGTIAGSLITIASLTSSLTIVTLQLLSSQYTPRTVRGFLRTRLAQTVFGSFLGVFIYCLLLLVTIRAPGEENDPFVPSLSLAVAIALSMVALGLLVLFVHTMSQTIQVSTMTARIGRETLEAIDEVHPERAGEVPDEQRPPPGGAQVRGARTGYVRTIDRASIGALGAPVSVLVRPGDFVTPGTVLALGDVPHHALEQAIDVGRERDVDADPAFGLRQITDIALRALSPGINDPTTAVTCIHYLREMLERLVGRSIPATRTVGEAVLAQWTFDEYLYPVSELAAYSSADVRVTGELAAMLLAVADGAARAGTSAREATVTQLATEILTPAIENAAITRDRDRLRALLAEASSRRS